MLSRILGLRRKITREHTSPAPAGHNRGENRKSTVSAPRAASPANAVSQGERELELNPLGLNVIYTPENGRKADIVFVHGLGGTSRWTWSKNRNPELFWPLTFLPLEPDLRLARILSFGYNANFRKSANASTVVLDFAKELLFDLKYANDEQKEHLNIGAVPLIFVAHSMGGLIVKEAYMQGQNDPDYENIVKAISAVLFLSTPHRGTDLADILNRLLLSTPLTSRKLYISELSRGSFTLEKLNEQFRHIAPRLDIISFYETQPTSIGGASVMILEKDSSVLGYPGEVSKPLNADHHSVCKYEHPDDPNYITVRNALKSIVSKIISTDRSKSAEASSDKGSRSLKSILAIQELPDRDYIFFQDQWTKGTNAWLLEDDKFSEWFDPRRSSSAILWVSGGAATGKSVLASFAINNFMERGVHCPYFFIRFADHKKRTLSLLLRSIAYQAAQCIPEFGFKIAELAAETVDFGEAHPKTIWERIFKTTLFKLEHDQPIYWVIDGLDEAEDARATIKLLSDIELSSIPIRVLLLSRSTFDITTALAKIPQPIYQGTISIEDHLNDIYTHIHQELSMSGSAGFREGIVQRLVAGARNNFLWVRLAVEKLNTCHTITDVERALQELPAGMEALYDRMSLSIANNPVQSGPYLARKILQCVACSFRILTVAELSQALHKDFSSILDFQQSIVELCGGFVTIDNGGNVVMIHHSVREYLLTRQDGPFVIDRDTAHEELFLSCMNCLMATGLRAKISRGDIPEFVEYSASSWSSHLALIPSASESAPKVAKRFLTGHWVLTWIHILTMTKQLRILIRASQHLSKYSAARQDIQITTTNGIDQSAEQQLFNSWAVDFVKILGKFGNNLRRDPETIYKTIPPFCPPNSAIFLQFGKPESKHLAVSGFSTPDWDDSIARLSFGSYASSVLAAGSQIAVLTSPGHVFVYDSSDFEEVNASPFRHGERVYRMTLNSAGTQLATYGFKTVKVWEVATGRRKVSVENLDSRPRPLAILFTNNNSTLLVGSEDRRIRSLNLTDPAPTWQLVAELEEPELEGHFLNSSSYMALNNEGSLAAVAYRGHPLSAWEIEGPVHINHCWRARQEVARGEVLEAVWHPNSPELLGLYIEGVVFKWNPYEGNPEEVEAGASRLTMSRDGNLFATGDVRGTVKVYTTSEFCLLYQLASQDTIFGLAFSPSLHRFYDIRGSYGNAWEPITLMRYAERLNKGSDSDSDLACLGHASTPSAASLGRIDSITVIAASPLGRLYCCGTENGVVRLYNTQHGKLSDLHISKGFHGIEQLVWSPDGNYICFSDISKNIFIMSIKVQAIESNRVEVESILEMSMRKNTTGPIIQLLFHPDSSHLLLSTPCTACVVSINQPALTHSIEWQSQPRKWIIHPQETTLMLAFEPNSVSIWDWSLTNLKDYQVKYPAHKGDDPATSEHGPETRVIDLILAARDEQHILVQMSQSKSLKEKKYIFSFTTTSFSLPSSSPAVTDTHTSVPILTPVLFDSESTSQIAIALSFLTWNRLIFLSKDFSISSWNVPFIPKTNKCLSNGTAASTGERGRNHVSPHIKQGQSSERIFMLPGDWINKDCLALCTVWTKERTFLCPRNGEIAVVKSARLG